MVAENLTVETAIEAFKFIFPAYCANAAPVIFGRGLPIDMNRKFFDGNPIFGKNKTFLGFFSGLVVGTLVSLAENLLFQHNFFLGFATSLGALLGDLTESFFKRRLKFPSGATLPVADQLDFVLGAMLLSLPISPPSPPVALIVLIVTPPIHVLTNYFAYLLGLKEKPW